MSSFVRITSAVTPSMIGGNVQNLQFVQFVQERIDVEHRLIYKVQEEALVIAQARGHYGDK